MRKLIVSEFISLDGVIQAPGGEAEDTDGGFTRGGWTRAFWHDDIGATFDTFMRGTDALLLGRRTYVTHAQAFEPDPANDPFGDTAKYVVSKTLEKSLWRNTTIIRDDIVGAVRALKAAPGKNILTDGSSQLVPLLFAHDLVDELHLLLNPIILGGGKRPFPDRHDLAFRLIEAKPYPSGVVGAALRPHPLTRRKAHRAGTHAVRRRALEARNPHQIRPPARGTPGVPGVER